MYKFLIGAIIVLLLACIPLIGCVTPVRVKPINTENQALKVCEMQISELKTLWGQQAARYTALYLQNQALLDHYYDHMEKEHPSIEERDL